jgi:imidazolonepropionase
MSRSKSKAVRIYSGGRVWSPAKSGAGVGTGAGAAEAWPMRALAEQGGRIVALGALAELQQQYPDAECIDLCGRLITPGFIDCHTHLVYAGDRSAEIERRLAGERYEDIARSGGGILSTVTATRTATVAELVQLALPRVSALLAEGVTTIEVKSGYGLELDTEIRMLQAARELGVQRRVHVSTTYLGAHALPPDYRGNADAYVERVCKEYLPAIAAGGWAHHFDAYCDAHAFSAAQVERLFTAARALGMRVKLHADQLSNQGGAALAARFEALSADHLEFTDEAGVAAMARSGCVAVLLPAAYYFLRQTQLPPIAALRRAGVPMAVATDCNPGTSPVASILAAMNFAALEFGLSVEECLDGVTRQAARALGLQQECGTIAPGYWCDLAVWNVTHPAELVLSLGHHLLHARLWRGQPDHTLV